MPVDPYSPSQEPSHISQIQSMMTLLGAARSGTPAAIQHARNALVMRYGKAIRSYVGSIITNDADADEVAHNIVVKMLQGDFTGWTQERGRFRDYLKVAVRNAALSALRQRSNARGQVAIEQHDIELADKSGEDCWTAAWRKSIIDGAFQELADYQRKHALSGNHFATIIRMLIDHPEEDSEQLAARLAEKTGQTIRADAFRKQVSRARRKFAELLVQEIERSLLNEATPERIEEELIELRLMPFVRNFLYAG
jgi:RNA polymerase sigma factor (sigma-70 family)